MPEPAFVTRFAPSPTGPLHLGHAYSALLAHDMARAAGGTFLLRIEDIDRSRARPQWEALISEDLAWLGIDWLGPALRQSDRMDRYHAALDQLWADGLLYPCSCRRRDIEAALSAPQEGVVAHGPDGPVYPGTCRPTTPPEGDRPRDTALRLDMARAAARLPDGALRFRETGPFAAEIQTVWSAHQLRTRIGDVVLARRDMGTAYHLSVVVDDADQGVTHVIRGRDLADATAIHILLQRLLSVGQPVYHHHRLIRDEAGKRLAKRDDARALRLYRAEGLRPDDIRRMVDLPVPALP